MKVTSPTYLLDNIYIYAEGKTIHHFDLYRLPTGCDLNMLGIPSVFDSSLCLIEWPQRLAEKLPLHYLDINITIDQTDGTRVVKLTPHGEKWMDKIPLLADTLFSDDSEI